jgi:hypothetical protein
LSTLASATATVSDSRVHVVARQPSVRSLSNEALQLASELSMARFARFVVLACS